MRLGQVLPRRRQASLNALLILGARSYHARRSFFGFPGASFDVGNDQTYHQRMILPWVEASRKQVAGHTDRTSFPRYTPKQLYELVSDVDNYHHFVPYCVESKVLSSKSSKAENGQEIEHKRARLAIGFLSFKESYVSDVTCIPYSSVEVRDGFFTLSMHRLNLKYSIGCCILWHALIQETNYNMAYATRAPLVSTPYSRRCQYLILA